MKYTLNQLQVFLKIVQTRSVTKAAEELFLTQPAVSIQLSKFQENFDLPLTEVIGRKIFITDFGREIAVDVEQILDQVKEIDRKSLAFKGQLTGTLKIAVVSTGKYVMPYFLSGFLQEHPGVDLKMDVTNKSTVIDVLENNRIDFALVSILPKKPRIERMDLLKNKLFLVGKAGRKFKKRGGASELFNDLPLIFREEGSGTRQAMERFIEQQDVHYVKKMELTSNEAVKQALLAGLGYSIMPLIGLRNEYQNNQLQIISVKGLPITTTWSIIWLKGKKWSPVASAYLDYLRHEKDKIVQENFSWYEKY
jgi:DNA-binding transcriptional LysR family regulator